MDLFSNQCQFFLLPIQTCFLFKVSGNVYVCVCVWLASKIIVWLLQVF